jgi:hypothetical protein
LTAAQPQATEKLGVGRAESFCFLHDVMKITNGEPFQKASEGHRQVAEFQIKKLFVKFKSFKCIIKSAEYTITRRELFVCLP